MDHQHTLQLNGSESSLFTCNGCKEQGKSSYNKFYNCVNRNCNYILHEECVEPVKHAVHPFFKNIDFKFYEKLKVGSYCDACGKDLLGFSYCCPKTGCALHPCCLNLPKFYFGETMLATLSHEVPSDCIICKQKHVVRNQFEGWSYVINYDGKSYYAHVSCFKDTINLEKKARGRMRSFMKFTGKLAVNVALDLITGDITNSISTIVEVLASNDQ